MRSFSMFAVSAMLVSVMGMTGSAPGLDWYYQEGPLRGSLKSDKPLPLYDSNPEHLWNRLFAAGRSWSPHQGPMAT